MAAELIVAGRIATLAGPSDTGWAWVEAIAIRGGRVIAGGTRADLDPLRGPATRTWTIPSDHVVLPGLTDAHLHLGDAARAATELDLSGLDRVGALDAIGAEHAHRLAAGDADGWLTGHGWSMDALGGRPSARPARPGRPGPRDRVVGARPSRPLGERGGDAAGSIGAGSATDGGVIERDADGSPTGLLLEARGRPRRPCDPGRTEAEAERALAAYAATLHALGVTGVHDPGEMAPRPGARIGPDALPAPRVGRTAAAAGRGLHPSRAARRRDRAGLPDRAARGAGNRGDGPLPGWLAQALRGRFTRVEERRPARAVRG